MGLQRVGHNWVFHFHRTPDGRMESSFLSCLFVTHVVVCKLFVLVAISCKHTATQGLSRWLIGQKSACQAGEGVWSLGWEDSLEKEMETYSSILAWRIPWTGGLVGYSPWGHKTVGHDLATKQHMCSSCVPFCFLTLFDYFILHCGLLSYFLFFPQWQWLYLQLNLFFLGYLTI